MTPISEDEKNSEVKELLEKNAKHTKQLKLVLAKLDEIDKKIDAVVSARLAQEDEKAKEKEKIDKIFEAKQVGRPAGSYETKQEQYVKMLNDGKIKQPKQQTLEYYKIVKVGDKYSVVDLIS